MEQVEKRVLENGLRILLLPLEGARSASVGIWVAAGPRNETAREQGVSHFIEHMLFKGTGRRTARGISEEMDRLGGSLNAYTAREYTRYYAQTLSENAAEAMDILCDMLTDPLLAPAETELERGVILDEMAMYEDSGEDVAHDALCAKVWPDSPLGRPICGVEETVSALTAADLREYMRRQYTPERMIAVAAGGFDREAVIALLERTLGRLPRGAGIPEPETPAFHTGLALTRKEFEQTSLVLGMPGLPLGHPDRYAMMVLNFIAGGGASSRLFLRLREELGLAYSVYSAHTALRGTGMFVVSASFSADQQQRVLSEIRGVLDGLTHGVTAEEFERALAQIKASHIMGMETVAARASFAGYNELYEGRQVESDEVLRRLDALAREDVNRLAREMLGNPARALSVAGDAKEPAFYETLFHGKVPSAHG